MCSHNFRRAFSPGLELSLDEACCGYKGRIRFRVFNATKPKKFHMKLYQVCESKSGYILGFEVYCGKDGRTCASTAPVVDERCTKTTKLVVGLMSELQLLDQGYHLYTDNYYTSVELAEELLSRDTYLCGTIRSNRKRLALSVTKPKKMTSGDCVYRRNDNMLLLRWYDKRPVTILSTIHSAHEVKTNKLDKNNQPIYKPVAIQEYTKHMRGVDKSDQVIQYYNPDRRFFKWYMKLWVHLVQMILTNSFILNSLFGKKKMKHEEYLEYIANYLITEGMKTAVSPTPPVRGSRGDVQRETRLDNTGHYPQKIPCKTNGKRPPSRPCVACNGSWQDMKSKRIPKRVSGIWCKKCEKTLCVSPCFEIYHTQENFQANLLQNRFPPT